MEILEFVDNLMKKTTPAAPAWNLEAANKSAVWNYVDGCMIKAFFDLDRALGDLGEKYYDFAVEYLDAFIIGDGEGLLGYKTEDYNCDHINMGKALFYIESEERKYERVIELLREQLRKQPRTASGNFWHKRIYPNQVWLDGLYMAQPFYLEYELKNDGDASDVFEQFKNVEKNMRDSETGLYYHCFDESREAFWCDKKTGKSPHFWLRSIGWFAMALVDCYEKRFYYDYKNETEKRSEDFDYLAKILQELVATLSVYEHNGMFYQLPVLGERSGNYLETSGTCAIAYSLLKGSRLGMLENYNKTEKAFDAGKRIFEAVESQKLIKKEDGIVLKDICLVAGLGGMPGKGSYKVRDGSYEYYISEPIVENDAKGVAPFLFAYSELCG